MNDNKRYYWIKLKTDFFNQETIDFLLSQKNGCEYIVLYQMLCLNTANNNGEMCSKIGEMIVPYNVDKIVRDTKYFDFDTVTIALGLFKQLGLIYEEKDKILKITNFNEMVGSEASNPNAQRQKRFRERQRQLKLSVTDSNVDSNAKNNEEIEIDIRDRDKSIDKDIDNINNKPVDTSCIQNGDTDKDSIELVKDSIDNNIYSPAKAEQIPYEEIIDYLNFKTNSNYKYTSQKTKDLIKARINNGFTIEDFKKVIDKKSQEWLGTDFEKFLRPETLFGNKFEGYLNQKIKGGSSNVFLDIMKNDYGNRTNY